MDWVPAEDRLIVKPNMPPERTASGIILPEMSREKPITGAVLAAAENVVSDHAIVPGDEVAFSKYGGVEFEGDDGEELIVLRITDILCSRSLQ